MKWSKLIFVLLGMRANELWTNRMQILLTGGRGMVGRAVLRLAEQFYPDLRIHAPTRSELDLRDQVAVKDHYESNRYDAVIHCGARVGGIKASVENPLSFLVQNIQINTNTIQYAFEVDIPNFIFVASSCMYPRNYKTPIKEEFLLEAPLEPTNEGYALSKICGAKHCEYISFESGYAYRTFVPCNLYGPYDDFTAEFSHLIAAAIKKIDAALAEGGSTVTIWGDGTARREFLFVDDFARFMLEHIGSLSDMPALINVGYGAEFTVLEYYQMIAETMGYDGEFVFDVGRPVGMKSKLMDSSRARALGWSPDIDIRDGIRRTVAYYRDRSRSNVRELYRRSKSMYAG